MPKLSIQLGLMNQESTNSFGLVSSLPGGNRLRRSSGSPEGLGTESRRSRIQGTPGGIPSQEATKILLGMMWLLPP